MYRANYINHTNSNPLCLQKLMPVMAQLTVMMMMRLTTGSYDTLNVDEDHLASIASSRQSKNTCNAAILTALPIVIIS